MKYQRVIVKDYDKKLDRKEGVVIGEMADGYYEVVVEGATVALTRKQIRPTGKALELRTLKLPKLNGLENITIMSTILKIQEELGEFCQLYGKDSGLNGEKNVKDKKEVVQNLAKELMDISQTCVSMAYVLEAEYGIDMNLVNDQHIRKLLTKGYLK